MPFFEELGLSRTEQKAIESEALAVYSEELERARSLIFANPILRELLGFLEAEPAIVEEVVDDLCNSMTKMSFAHGLSLEDAVDRLSRRVAPELAQRSIE